MQLTLIFSGLILGLYLLGRWMLRAGPARAAYAIRWFMVVSACFFLLLLVSRGGAGLALPLLVLLAPVLVRWRQLWNPPPSASSQRAQDKQHSTVETQFIRMSLDHDSGKLSGSVLRGRFARRQLGDLALEELLELWRECQADAQSAAVLESYLDRCFGDDWRDRSAGQRDRFQADSAAMTRKDAFEILGLEPGATREEIKTAHRRLMQRVHPDHGGSTYLASRVNRAKDLLLDE